MKLYLVYFALLVVLANNATGIKSMKNNVAGKDDDTNRTEHHVFVTVNENYTIWYSSADILMYNIGDIVTAHCQFNFTTVVQWRQSPQGSNTFWNLGKLCLRDICMLTLNLELFDNNTKIQCTTPEINKNIVISSITLLMKSQDTSVLQKTSTETVSVLHDHRPIHFSCNITEANNSINTERFSIRTTMAMGILHANKSLMIQKQLHYNLSYEHAHGVRIFCVYYIMRNYRDFFNKHSERYLNSYVLYLHGSERHDSSKYKDPSTTMIPVELRSERNLDESMTQPDKELNWIWISGLIVFIIIVCSIAVVIKKQIIRKPNREAEEAVASAEDLAISQEEPEYDSVGPPHPQPLVDTVPHLRPQLDPPPEYEYSYVYDHILPPPRPPRPGQDYSYVYDHRTCVVPRTRPQTRQCHKPDSSRVIRAVPRPQTRQRQHSDSRSHDQGF